MRERITIQKVFFIWDFEKEERWLNEMAMSGWALCFVRLCRYTFEKCEPGEYTIRMEMRGQDPDYISFMSETGASYVGRIFNWIYFRQRTGEGSFDIFSDIDSRIQHLDKIGKALQAIGSANIIIGIANVFNPSHLGFINLLVAILLMYALGRIHEKKESLEKDRLVHE
ncbi:MAG TPA: DUF2812 domain-containing protein [Clostridiaceae bacterium]|nr:DUF2812 domain-containing protein [Clostridiaceae bacterium]